ncbi:MAG: hypothetical protein ACOX8Q_09375, partial [Christensenellales bacterium]
MYNIPSARLTAPKSAAGEIVRNNLIDAVLNSPSKLVYIHAGAGHGKTTLLSQVANSVDNVVWLSLDGENDILTFINTLCVAIKQTFPEFDFSPSEYMLFSEKNNFISILAGGLIGSIENTTGNFIAVMDDLHTIEDDEVKRLIACLIKFLPNNAKLCFGSRQIPPPEFLAYKVKGNITELTQKELAFTREEIADILGFDDPAIYASTEGWPLAIRSFRVLLEHGIHIGDITSYGKETLYAYLFCEYIANLNADMVDFLKKSACFDVLDAQMLDAVLDKKDTKLILESLVSRNIFTIKTSDGLYHYHALFRSSLLETGDKKQIPLLRQKAARYYYEHKQYSRAARYAIDSKDNELLENTILSCYRDYIKAANYNELRIWFRSLNDAAAEPTPRILVAKGAFLSVIGNFVHSKACLEA